MGPPTTIMDVDDAAEALSHSAFMRVWCANKIKECLLAGDTFEHSCRTDVDGSWRGRPDGVVARYKLANDDEIQSAADHSAVVSTGHAVSKKALDKGYQLFYMSDADRTAAYSTLPFQAKKVLDLLKEHGGGDTFSELRVHAIMTEHGAVLKTKQDPMKIFAYYRSTFLKQELLKET
jgi:hypothetical protein